MSDRRHRPALLLRRRGALFLAALTAPALLWQGALFATGYWLTADDLYTLFIGLQGPGALADWAWRAAEQQGRIGQLAMAPLNVAGSLLAGWEAGRIAIAVLYAAVAALFAVHMGQLTHPRLAWPVFLAWLALQPLAYEHMPPNAYPLQNSLPFALLLACRIRLHRAGSSPLALTGMAAAMLVTEYALLLGLALLLASWAAEAGQGGWRRLAGHSRARAEAAILAATLAVHLGFRLLVPSRYEGNAPEGAFALARLAETTLHHILAGTVLPRLEPALALAPAGTWLAALATGLALGAAMALALWRLPRWRPPLAAIAALAALGMLIVTLPVTAALRQQRWCLEDGVCGYLDSRTSALGLAVLLAAGALALANRPARRRAACLAAGAVTALIATAAGLHNAATAARMAGDAAVWHRAALLHCAPEARPADPAGLGPTIDPERRLPFAPGEDRAAFWSLYLARAGLWVACPADPAARERQRAEIVRLGPRLALGTRLAMGERTARRILGTGWSGTEAWGVWSDGAEASLILQPAPGEAARPARLRLSLTAYLDARTPRQRVTVLLDGRLLAEHRFDAGLREAEISIDLSAPRPADHPLTLTLRISNPRDPQGQGDPRRLGIGLRTVTLERR